MNVVELEDECVRNSAIDACGVVKAVQHDADVATIGS
jgi:hypothetical protein